MNKFIVVCVLVALIVGSLLIMGNSDGDVFMKADFTNYNDNIGPIAASHKTYENVEQALDDSDLIVSGEVIEVREPERLVVGYTHNNTTGEDEPVDVLYTVSVVKIKKCYRGDFKEGDVVEVKQLGAENTLNEKERSSSHFYKNGEEYVFFLNTYFDVDKDAISDPLNPKQGQIRISNNRVDKQNSVQFVVDGVSEKALDEELTRLLND